MCHLILLMPVLAIPLFWLTPLNMAVPIYLVIVLVSGLLYWLIVKSMREPAETGVESLIGTEAKVVSRLASGHHAQYLVRARGELWTARSTAVLQPGETVDIAALAGISLVVEPKSDGTSPDKPPSMETEQAKAKVNARHCH